MARTQAKLFASIWTEPDWLALPGEAKLLYLTLLSQPRLTLAGCIDLMAGRWAKMVDPAAVVDDITETLDVLESARFVVVDDDEVLLRTFTRYDVASGSVNANIVKGMWSAWRSIRSAPLRKVVVDELPESLWNRGGVDRPFEAEELRSQPRLELPLQPPFEPPFEPPSEPSLDLHSALRSPLTAPSLISGDLPVTGTLVRSADEIEQAARKALKLAADAIAVGKNNPGAYAAVTGRTWVNDGTLDRLRCSVTAGATPEEAAGTVAVAKPDDPDPTGREAAKAKEQATRERQDASMATVPVDPAAALAKIRREMGHDTPDDNGTTGPPEALPGALTSDSRHAGATARGAS